MIQSGLSRYTMEERDLCPIDFKHALYVKQLMIGRTRYANHGKARHVHLPCYPFTLLGASLFIYTNYHPLSVVSDGEEFAPRLPLIGDQLEGLSSPLRGKSHLECLEQSALFLAVNVSFRFALEEMFKKTLFMSF